MMDLNNSFDAALDARFRSPSQEQHSLIYSVTSRTPGQLRDAAIFTADTLDLCWLAAQSIFKKQAKPEHAFELFDRLALMLKNYHEERLPTSTNDLGKGGEQMEPPRLTYDDLIRKTNEVNGIQSVK